MHDSAYIHTYITHITVKTIKKIKPQSAPIMLHMTYDLPSQTETDFPTIRFYDKAFTT